MSFQRKLILLFTAGIAVGLYLPWAYLGKNAYNALDHVLFRIPLVGMTGLVAVLALFVGRRTERVDPATLFFIVLFSTTIAVMAGVVAYGVAGNTLWAIRVGPGPFVVIVDAVLVIAFGVLRTPGRTPSIGEQFSEMIRR
jgi:hypothetical protein